MPSLEGARRILQVSRRPETKNFPNCLNINGYSSRCRYGKAVGLNRERCPGDDLPCDHENAQDGMVISRALLFSLSIVAIAASTASSAMAQAWTRQGTDVSCDDGRHGIFAGDAIIWADRSRSSLASSHPSVIIGNKSSVIVGPGVFVGHGSKGVVPFDNPSAPNKARCPVLDGLSYCY